MKETKSEIFYLDDNNNIVDEEHATQARILEEDEKGNRISETYMVLKDDNRKDELEDIVLTEEEKKLIDSLEWRDPVQQYEYALAHDMIKGFESVDDGYVDPDSPRKR